MNKKEYQEELKKLAEEYGKHDSDFQRGFQKGLVLSLEISNQLSDIPEGFEVLSEEYIKEHKNSREMWCDGKIVHTHEWIDIEALEKLLIPINTQSNPSRFNTILEEMADLYAKKNSDYGDSFGDNFNKFGLISAVVRMSDKLNRIENAIHTDYQVDEKLRDTLIDLANYAIMTILELEKETINHGN